MNTKKHEVTDKQLREFGLVMAVALIIFSDILIYKRQAFVLTAIVMLSFALCFMISAYFKPRVLVPLEFWWMKFAEKLSVVMTFVIMCLLYYLVMTPIGLLLRLTGKDLLQLKLEKNKKSYWEPCPADGPGSRPFTPY